MGIIRDAQRRTVIVDPTRIKGDRRVFKNVVPATTAGMSFDPAKHNLQVVHEPRKGYRCIALEAVVSDEPAKNQKQSEETLRMRGWAP